MIGVARSALRTCFACSETSESTNLLLLKTPRTRNEAGGIIQDTCVFRKFGVLDVDVGWERSEPMEQVKHLLPISAVRTHMKLEVDGTASRFRLTEQST